MQKPAPMVALCLLVAAGTANAAESSTVLYDAFPSCPDRAEFLSEVRARTDEWHESPTALRTFIVRLTARDDGSTRGSLVIAQSGRSGTPRVVDAATCAEVVRALSFIVALAIDPYAKAPVSNAVTPESPPASNPSVASSPPAPLSPAAPLARVEASAPYNRRSIIAERPPTIAWSAGFSADALGLAAPGPVLGAGVFVGFRLSPRFDVRVSVHQTLPSTVKADRTSTSIAWTTARLEPCVSMLPAGRFDVQPCAFVELGRLAAEGGGVDKTEVATRVWGSGGAAARAELALTGALRFEVAGGFFVPFDRTEVTYRPAFVAYRPPAVGALVSLGAVVRWH